MRGGVGAARVRVQRSIFGAVAALVLTVFVTPATAGIVERIVAVVGERPILLSELRRRAHPYLLTIAASQPDPVRQTAAETDLFKKLLGRVVDDRLEEQAADKAHISITSEEVERALKNKADAMKLGVNDLLAEARREGMTDTDYREEVRRQLLEGKLIQLRVAGRVRVTEQDARAAYARWLKEMGDQAPGEVRIIAMRIQPGMAESGIQKQVEAANDVVGRARRGEDFCELVRAYSDDVQTKPTCGSRGPQPTSALLPVVQQVVAPLKEGQISDPLRVNNEAIIIAQLYKAPRVPPFEEVKESMNDRAVNEVLEKQRQQWLEELRRATYVDIRL